jgi:hypothetical protein
VKKKDTFQLQERDVLVPFTSLPHKKEPLLDLLNKFTCFYKNKKSHVSGDKSFILTSEKNIGVISN